MLLETVYFKRAKKSHYEPGILINEGAGKILDRNGEMPDKCFKWKRHPAFSIDLGAIFTQMMPHEKCVCGPDEGCHICRALPDGAAKLKRKKKGK